MLNDEIEDLKKALEASPDNSYLQLMLIRKMSVFPAYSDELETLLQRALQNNPNSIELKGLLIEMYFRQGKVAPCIIIAEEIGAVEALSPDQQAIVAKCYLQEGDTAIAKDIYRKLTQREPGYKDEELDAAFRLSNAKTEQVDEDQLLFSKPDINFSDVGGMEQVKREIDLKIIKPLKTLTCMRAMGRKLGEEYCFMAHQDVVRHILRRQQPVRSMRILSM